MKYLHLYSEMARVRNLIPVLRRKSEHLAYVAVCTLERAEIALADDDVESMIAAYEDLKGINVTLALKKKD